MVSAGDQYGFLTVINREGSREYVCKGRVKKIGLWRCRCVCGREVLKTTSEIKNLKSCGCKTKALIGEKSRTHGMSKTRIYGIYSKMKERCYNSNSERYRCYGARGIRICSEWLADFMNFYNWAVSNGYEETLSIDRIDVDGDYSPDNCRWVDNKEQTRNMRKTLWLSVNGERKSLAEWAEKTGYKYHRVFHWYKKDGPEICAERIARCIESGERVVPLGNVPTVFMGKRYPSLRSLCNDMGADYKTVHQRVRSLGWTLEEALEMVERRTPSCRKGGKKTCPIVAVGPGEEISEFENITSATKYFGVDRSSISHALNEQRRVKGYRLFWKDDLEG